MGRISEEEKARFSKYLILSMDKLESPKNIKKSHWDSLDLKYLVNRLNEEMNEFNEAFLFQTKDHMKDELKDIINFSLMIWDHIENIDENGSRKT